jgi:hypothetical protein
MQPSAQACWSCDSATWAVAVLVERAPANSAAGSQQSNTPPLGRPKDPRAKRSIPLRCVPMATTSGASGWRQNVRADVGVMVVSRATGKKVRAETLGSLRDGSRRWKWNRRNSKGSLVPKGRYVVAVRGRAAGTRDQAEVAVVVDTKTVYTKKTLTKGGTKTSSSSWSSYSLGGNCDGSSYRGELLSSCLFAGARAVYGFSVPSNAALVSKSVARRSGVARCRKSAVSVSRSGGTLRLTFTHGNRSGFSQCWVKRGASPTGPNGSTDGPSR